MVQPITKIALRKYTEGKKLGITQFNQAARLAWLGLVALSPLDPDDADCRAWMLHLQHPTGLAGEILNLDTELMGRMHVLDAEQGQKLAEILREGVAARAKDLMSLEQRDFYLDRFMRQESV